jgi:hypothetical protein
MILQYPLTGTYLPPQIRLSQVFNTECYRYEKAKEKGCQVPVFFQADVLIKSKRIPLVAQIRIQA